MTRRAKPESTLPREPVSVPSRFADLVGLFVELLERRFPAEEPEESLRSPVDAPLHEAPRAHVIGFARELLRFARDNYGTGRRSTAPHCVAVLMLFQVTHGRRDVAEAILREAAADSKVARGFRDFFESLDEEERPVDWEAGLQTLIETGALKSLGAGAANRIGVAKHAHQFVQAFDKHLRQRHELGERRDEYRSWLRSLLPPGVPFGEDSLGADGTLGQSLSVGAAWTKWLMVGLAIMVAPLLVMTVRSMRCTGEKEPVARATASDANVGRSTAPSGAIAGADTQWVRCKDRKNGFEVKKCLIEFAENLRGDYPAAAAAYRRALEYRYDAVGLGDMQLGSASAYIAERDLDKWQDLRAQEGLASLHALHRNYRAALVTFRTYLELKRRHPQIAGAPLDADCFVLMALERRTGEASRAVEASASCGGMPSGPSMWGIHQYELGLAYEDAGKPEESLMQYARATGIALEASQAERRERTETWKHSRWAVLVDSDSVLADAQARLAKVAAKLAAQERAVVDGDAIVWTEQGVRSAGVRIGATWRAMHPTGDCLVDEEGPPDPLDQRKDWRLTLTLDGRVFESGRGRREWFMFGTVARDGRAKSIDLAFEMRVSKPKVTPAGCLNQVVKMALCLLEDGRLRAGACD